jgi:hypothetical protein
VNPNILIVIFANIIILRLFLNMDIYKLI